MKSMISCKYSISMVKRRKKKKDMSVQRVNMDIDRELWRRTKVESARRRKTLRCFISELLDKNVPVLRLR